jgi:hypothetical protein
MAEDEGSVEAPPQDDVGAPSQEGEPTMVQDVRPVTIYPSVKMAVVPGAPGQKILVIDKGIATEQFPMTDDYCAALCKQGLELLGPRIEVAPATALRALQGSVQNGHGPR